MFLMSLKESGQKIGQISIIMRMDYMQNIALPIQKEGIRLFW